MRIAQESGRRPGEKVAAQGITRAVAADPGDRLPSCRDRVHGDESDRSLLVAAVWLHGIGYSPAIRDTGFHPLGGGLWLRQNGPEEASAIPLIRSTKTLTCSSTFARHAPGAFEQLVQFIYWISSPEDSIGASSTLTAIP